MVGENGAKWDKFLKKISICILSSGSVCFAVLSGNEAVLKVWGERTNRKLSNSSSLHPGVELVVAGYPFSPRFLC
jgi:hypothetical protein